LSSVRETHRFIIHPYQIIKPESRPCASNPQDDSMQAIVLNVYAAANKLDTNTSGTYSWVFKYDTKPPPAPTITSTIGGGKRIQLSWTPPVPDTDVDTYEVWFCPNASDYVLGTGADASDGGTGADGGTTGSDAAAADASSADGGTTDGATDAATIGGTCNGMPDPHLPCSNPEKRSQICL
jgi:hypothetical protein